MALTSSLGAGCNPVSSDPATDAAFLQPPPGAFVILSATAGNGQVSLAWQNSADATNYNVLRGTDSGSYPITAATELASNTFTDTGLVNGVTYFYQVQAVGPGGITLATVEAQSTPAFPPLLVIADTGNNRIVTVSDMTGAGFATFGGLGPDQLSGPEGVYLDSSGFIWIADTLNSRIIQVQDISGDGFTPFGADGSGIDEFHLPASVALDTSGNLFVADTGNGRIVEMADLTGSSWQALSSNGIDSFISPASIGFGPTSGLSIADPGAHHVVSIDDLSGSGWTNFSGGGAFSHPTGIFVADDGSTYVADSATSTVYQMASSGTIISALAGNGGGDSFFHPTGVCVDSSGIIYVADSGNDRIVSVTDMAGDNWTVLNTVGSDSLSAPHSIYCRYGTP